MTSCTSLRLLGLLLLLLPILLRLYNIFAISAFLVFATLLLLTFVVLLLLLASLVVSFSATAATILLASTTWSLHNVIVVIFINHHVSAPTISGSHRTPDSRTRAPLAACGARLAHRAQSLLEGGRLLGDELHVRDDEPAASLLAHQQVGVCPAEVCQSVAGAASPVLHDKLSSLHISLLQYTLLQWLLLFLHYNFQMGAAHC
jgi:hypothetical protein